MLLVNLEGSPAWVNDRELWRENRVSGQLTLPFIDKDDFKLTSLDLPMSKFSTMVNDKDETIGLNAEDSTYIDLKDYKRIMAMQVQWRLRTERPRAPPRPVRHH